MSLFEKYACTGNNILWYPGSVLWYPGSVLIALPEYNFHTTAAINSVQRKLLDSINSFNETMECRYLITTRWHCGGVISKIFDT